MLMAMARYDIAITHYAVTIGLPRWCTPQRPFQRYKSSNDDYLRRGIHTVDLSNHDGIRKNRVKDLRQMSTAYCHAAQHRAQADLRESGRFWNSVAVLPRCNREKPVPALGRRLTASVGSALFAGGVRVLGLASVPLFRPWATGSNGHDKAAYTQHGGRMAVGGTRIVRPNPPIKPTASGV